jgi:hypothetical protein
MRTQYRIRRHLLVNLFCGLWLLALAGGSTAVGAVLMVDQVNGSFTVTGFQVVDGVTEAVGYLTAEATDSEGQAIDVVTNSPVRLPVMLSGALAGKAALLASASEYIPPPQLSTNLCTILAISIAFVDVTIPGLGLNVHVNQLLIGVRADRETRLGDVLCTLLGEDAYLDLDANTPSNSPNLSIKLEGDRVVLDAKGPATLQSTTSLKHPISWRDVLTLGPIAQRLLPSGTAEFFRLAMTSSGSQAQRGAFSLGSVNGVFTVSDFKSVDGRSMAAGWLSANVTDTTETSEVGTFANFPVRVPVSGVLAGEPVSAGFVSDPVILPELSTNTCSLLGIVVGAIDITIPGLGLNLHVNEISIVVRADRETTVGDLLCTLLGDDLLGAPVVSGDTETNSGPPRETSMEANGGGGAMSLGQLRALADIVLDPGSADSTDASTAETSSKTKGPKGASKKKAELELAQKLVQRVIATMQPSTSLPKVKGKKEAKSKAK